MAYRNGTYSAFYVSEPFDPSGLGAYKAKDFVYYMTVKMWRSADPGFPFVDSHDRTYNVRDGSSWECTLKPRLRERLRSSKNILLFLSERTKASRALSEEMTYGIKQLRLPVIVVYPDLDPINLSGNVSYSARALWDKLPAFKNNMWYVPTLHVPLKKDALRKALDDPDLMIQTKASPGTYRL